MSGEGGGSAVRIADVDVDESMKENVEERCNLPGDGGDSGTETLDTAPGSCAASSDSEVSPAKHVDSPVSNDRASSTDLGFHDNSLTKSISESLCSDNCGNAVPLGETAVDHSVDINLDSNVDIQIDTLNVEHQNDATGVDGPQEAVIVNVVNDCQSSDTPTQSNNDSKDLTFHEHHIQNSNVGLEKACVAEEIKLCNTSESQSCCVGKEKQIFKLDFNITNKSLTTSTTSLNDQTHSNNIDNHKSPYSRSAENICTMEENPSSSNSSIKDLNTEQILTEFTSQKNKVRATQKISNETPHVTSNNTDLRYPKIPKEILSQDLGSIAKSVHGIFSSVSGSLKNAYNNTQRVSSVKLPIKNLVKPVNGNLMNEIFEDNVPEANVVSAAENLNNKKESDDRLSLNVEEAIGTLDGSTDDETNKDLVKLQIESLERVLAEQRRENSSLRERVKQQMDELQAKDQTFKELEAKVDLMCKRAEQASREKDAAVMRYAGAECAAIEARRAAEAATRAERAAAAERDLLAGKLRSARDERERICRLYDDKSHEARGLEADVSRAREEARELEQRLKWTQSKLRTEMDACKEASERADKLSQQVSELEAAREAAAAGAADSAKAKQYEAELRESQAALILCRHERAELERRGASAAQQLDQCRRDRDRAARDLADALAQVAALRDSNQRLEQEAAELAALRAQAALADTLASQLQRESERASQAEAALSRERARAETCARREAAALEHAARLTAQHVAQRAGAADAEAKVSALSADNAALRERDAALSAELAALAAALRDETERRRQESRALARRVAELTEEAAEAKKQLEWEKGENGVLKKKHASAVRELNRELSRALRRCEQLQARLPPADAPSTRTGSVTSLSSGESAPDERLHNGHADALPDVHGSGAGAAAAGAAPERQALIERIVSLQRAAARRADRCEFLEEHARALTDELRAKSRLLRQLLPALPAAHAHAIREHAQSEELPAALSQEVSRRLQALLEDTLLKNITLKENIDTLGEEVARLRKQLSEAGQPPP